MIELFEAATEILAQPVERLRLKGIKGRKTGVTRERWLIAMFLWEAGASKMQIARQLNQHHTTIHHALLQVGMILKSSEAFWWRTAVDRLHRVAGTCQSKLSPQPVDKVNAR